MNSKHKLVNAIDPYTLTLMVTEDNSQADKVTMNEVDATAFDTETFFPAPGVDVVFKIVNSSTAFFSQTNSPIYASITDGTGHATAMIGNSVAEKVSITVEYKGNPAIIAEASVTFTEATDNFQITNVVNSNHTFLQNQPSIAWPGSAFLIETRGGSGKVNWEAVSSSAELSVSGTTTGDCSVTILAKPRQICTIKGTDSITNETVEWTFFIDTFVKSDFVQCHLSDATHNHGDYLLTPAEYERLHHEWGEMSAYPIWDVTDVYWTSDYDLTSAVVCDLSTGILSTESHLHQNFYAYRIDL